MQQLTINLERSLTEQYATLMDAVRGMVYNSGIPLKTIAAELDQSVSELSRRLSPADPLPLSVDDLEKLLVALCHRTELKPIYYQVEKFLEDPESKRNRAIDRLAKMLPEIQGVLNQVRG